MRDLLCTNNAIHCDGELLNFEWGYVRSRLLLAFIKTYPFPYLEYMKRKAARDIYGFKMLFYQPRMKRYVLRRLHRTGWRFIHVYRQNIVHQSLSKLIAVKTRCWHRRDGDRAPDYQVYIDVNEMESEIELRKRWAAKERELLSGIDRLEITYETELKKEKVWPSTIEKVALYLGITPFAPGRIALKRTDERPYAEIVTNYPEIRSHLQQSECDELLE